MGFMPRDGREWVEFERETVIAVMLTSVFAGVFWYVSDFVAGGTVASTVAAPLDISIGQEIHWQTVLTISVCGAEKELPRGAGSRPGIYTENDTPKIHMEMLLGSPSDVSLGRAMDSLGIKFDSGHLYDKKNGDLCPGGKPGKVRVFAGGKESAEFRNLVLRDGMNVRVEFKP